MKKSLVCVLLLALLFNLFPMGAFAGQTSHVFTLMYENASKKLDVKLGSASASRIQWSSSDENVATANRLKVNSHAAGTALLTASYQKKTLRCTVVVLPRELSVKLGESVTLPGTGKESYAVEHKKIASINKKGEILGKKPGTTRIAVLHGAQKKMIKLKVLDASGNEQQSEAAELECADETEQIVLVDYQGGSRAKLSVHEKQWGAWKKLYSCDAYVGRNGIGKVKEGDGKTPTGTYNLTQPFGILADPGASMAYTKVTKYHYWCGTSGSKYYNQLVDEREVNRKHTSSDEYLIDYKGVYNYCMFIDYNAEGKAGKGSCIFLHCKGSKNSTAGCIAVSEANMKKIVCWAKPGCKIVIRKAK